MTSDFIILVETLCYILTEYIIPTLLHMTIYFNLERGTIAAR